LRDSRPFLELRERCRAVAAEKYGWDRVVDRVEEEFFKAARPRSCDRGT
jgi:glycosyltransferase involved in cell wall biosynthesis